MVGLIGPRGWNESSAQGAVKGREISRSNPEKWQNSVKTNHPWLRPVSVLERSLLGLMQSASRT